MKNVILAALQNEGLLIDSDDIIEVKFARQTCNDHNLGAIYYAITYDDNEDNYNVVSIFLDCETLTADFGGAPHFEGTLKQCREYFYE